MLRQPKRTAPRLLVLLIAGAGLGLGLSIAASASAKEIVTLSCEGAKHVVGKAGKKTFQDVQSAWSQQYTLDDNGTFIALTSGRGTIGKGRLTVTSKRYFLDYDTTDPEIKRNGGGLYIDRETGALYSIGIKRENGREFTFISSGRCKVDPVTPKF